MQFSQLALAAAIAASSVDALAPYAIATPGNIAPRAAMGTGEPSVQTGYFTQTVTAYVTYCPEPTTFVQGNNTYIVVQSNTWVTVNCPGYCTISNVAGAQPTVVPAGVIPKYGNATAQCPGNGTCPQPLHLANGTAPAALEFGSNNGSNEVSPAGPSGASSASSASGAGSEAHVASSSDALASGSGSESPKSGENGQLAFTGTAEKLFISSAALAAFAGAVILAL